MCEECQIASFYLNFFLNYVHVYIYLRAEEFQFPRVGVAGHFGKLLMAVLGAEVRSSVRKLCTF